MINKVLASQIIMMLNKRSDVDIVSASLCKISTAKDECLAIDAKTGDIFTLFHQDQLDHGMDYKQRLELVSKEIGHDSPLRLTFDGRESLSTLGVVDDAAADM